jgi:tRNA-specific 2-thiouridylase
LRGVDTEKDQSYFLYGLTQEELATTLFPIGGLTKSEVRDRAREAGLTTAEKAESQDICFVSGSVKEFLERQGVATAPGRIVTSAGQTVGHHDGVHAFTVGQRKGLRLGGSDEPLYVLELLPDQQLVVVGTKRELEQSEFSLDDMVVINPELREALARTGAVEFEARAQLRHRHPGVPVRVKLTANNPAEVTFLSEWTTVTPGQAGVLYDPTNTEVLGGGTIMGRGAKASLSVLS